MVLVVTKSDPALVCQYLLQCTFYLTSELMVICLVQLGWCKKWELYQRNYYQSVYFSIVTKLGNLSDQVWHVAVYGLGWDTSKPLQPKYPTPTRPQPKKKKKEKGKEKENVLTPLKPHNVSVHYFFFSFLWILFHIHACWGFISVTHLLWVRWVLLVLIIKWLLVPFANRESWCVCCS